MEVGAGGTLFNEALDFQRRIKLFFLIECMFHQIQRLGQNVVFDPKPYGTLYHTAPHSRRTG